MQDYQDKIARIHQELGIPADYPKTSGMVLQAECENLVETEPDVFGRQPLMEAGTWEAWQSMKHTAAQQGVSLLLVSAYRSADYQHTIFNSKLAKGQCLEDILKVNAAPGYSEHHCGTALDIGCPGFPHLEEVFEDSPAYQWLEQHAGGFGFRLSFPRNNAYGVLYEPWHWKFCGLSEQSE